MGKIFAGLAILIVVVSGILYAVSNVLLKPSPPKPELTSLADSAQTLRQAGELMQRHGQEMIDQGKITGNADLTASGQHWLRDGQDLVQEAHWMGMDPTASPNIVGSVSVPDWIVLTQNARAMLYDPTKGGPVNVQALLVAGMSLSSEGQNLAEHGQVMKELTQVMAERGELTTQDQDDLTSASDDMIEVGATLAEDGERTVAYAQQLQPGPFSLGR